jgi:hypothetical protein
MFSQTIADAICARLAEGEPLREICRSEGMPAWRTVYDWIGGNADFATRIAHARASGYDAIAEETLEIADDSRNDWMDKRAEEGDEKAGQFNGENVQRAKLRIETRLKLLAKWSPKKYGDKIELGGSVDVHSKIERITRRIVDGTGTGDA